VYARCRADSRGLRFGVSGLCSLKFRIIPYNPRWCHLQSQAAPYIPPAGRTIGALIDTLSHLPRDHPDFAAALKQITANFDDFSALSPDDPRAAAAESERAAAGASKVRRSAGRDYLRVPASTLSWSGSPVLQADDAPSQRARKKFIGYTFKRGADGRLAMPGMSGSSVDGPSHDAGKSGDS
jgi:hypothetical protein